VAIAKAVDSAVTVVRAVRAKTLSKRRKRSKNHG